MDTIKFIRQKDYKLIREIGQGGTGRTILIKDETINEEFICKKYSPYYKETQAEYYKYFIDEIKILYTINHKNIVRVFNYYLYPEVSTGYILMEHIHGASIDKFITDNPDKIEDVFLQLIDGFKYLEQNGILHRDIRPENILVSKEGIIKIIDFGFGKITEFTPANKSISLNWRYPVPNEFDNQIYDGRTEVYFLGKLLEDILQKIDNVRFKYSKIISSMIEVDYDTRIRSFFDVYRETITINSLQNDFSQHDKKTYQFFAASLVSAYASLSDEVKYNDDIDSIMRQLEELYKNSLLEDVIQNNDKLVRIFVEGTYRYYTQKKIPVSNLYSFIQFLKSLSDDKRKIVINNLWERLDGIQRVVKDVDDLPF